MRIWSVMDDCIRTGVSSAEEKLPGRIGLRRRAPILYRRLMRGYILRYTCLYPRSWLTDVLPSPLLSFYPGLAAPMPPAIGAGGAAIGHIRAPEGPAGSGYSAPGHDPENGHVHAGNRSPTKPGAGPKISASRPTRVIGVLDHPVTPMPPVNYHGACAC